MLVAALAAGVTGAWSPCGFSMVETLAPSGYAGQAAHDDRRLRDVRRRRARRRRRHLRRARAARPRARARRRAGRGRGDRPRRRARRGPRTRGSCPQVRRQVPESWRRVHARPARRRPLRRPARPRLHHLHPHASPCGRWRAIAVALGDPLARPRDRPRLRRRPHAPGDRARARSAAARLHAAMAEQPRILRSPAAARRRRAHGARRRALRRARPGRRHGRRDGFTDPVLDGPRLALHRPGGTGEIRGPERHRRAARHPPRGRRRPPRLDRRQRHHGRGRSRRSRRRSRRDRGLRRPTSPGAPARRSTSRSLDPATGSPPAP